MKGNNLIKIIAIPYAGGNSYCYKKLENLVPYPFEWHTVELPGRGTRLRENPIVNVDELCNDILEKAYEILKGSQYILYGHSMGTLLGYELMKKINNNRSLKLPQCAFFTGRGGPGSDLDDNKKIADMETECFWEEVFNLGGIPQDIKENRELLDFVEPILRSDFKLAENYEYTPLKKPMNIRFFVRAGNEEEEIDAEKLNSWQKESLFPVDIKMFPGNHFFIFDRPNVIVQDIISSYHSSKREIEVT